MEANQVWQNGGFPEAPANYSPRPQRSLLLDLAMVAIAFNPEDWPEIIFSAGREVEYEELLAAAREKYPNQAFTYQKHHINPQYIGGAKNGEKITLDAAYHQEITNTFRDLYPYRQGPIDNLATQRKLMIEVYTRFPLPYKP